MRPALFQFFLVHSFDRLELGLCEAEQFVQVDWLRRTLTPDGLFVRTHLGSPCAGRKPTRYGKESSNDPKLAGASIRGWRWQVYPQAVLRR